MLPLPSYMKMVSEASCPYLAPMAEFGKPGEPESMIPPVTQEELADMIGTTRSLLA